jgi:ribosomal protein L16 Arg81 hydroxylase
MIIYDDFLGKYWDRKDLLMLKKILRRGLEKTDPEEKHLVEYTTSYINKLIKER